MKWSVRGARPQQSQSLGVAIAISLRKPCANTLLRFVRNDNLYFVW